MSILIEALSHIWKRPKHACIIIALPLVLNVSAELYSAHRYVLSDYASYDFSSTIVMLVNFITTAVIAVCWHRLVLMDEGARIVPRSRFSLYFRYLIQWLIVGFLIGLIMLMVFGAGAAVIWFSTRNAIWAQVVMSWFYAAELNSIGTIAIMTLVISLYCWLFFRCAVTLPHLALGRGEATMRQGWRVTQHIAKQIAVAAVLAGILQALLMWFQSQGLFLLMIDAEGYLPVPYDYVAAVLYSLSYSILPLIGASILTTIYTRFDAEEFEIN